MQFKSQNIRGPQEKEREAHKGDERKQEDILRRPEKLKRITSTGKKRLRKAGRSVGEEAAR